METRDESIKVRLHAKRTITTTLLIRFVLPAAIFVLLTLLVTFIFTFIDGNFEGERMGFVTLVIFVLLFALCLKVQMRLLVGHRSSITLTDTELRVKSVFNRKIFPVSAVADIETDLVNGESTFVLNRLFTIERLLLGMKEKLFPHAVSFSSFVRTQSDEKVELCKLSDEDFGRLRTSLSDIKNGRGVTSYVPPKSWKSILGILYHICLWSFSAFYLILTIQAYLTILGKL